MGNHLYHVSEEVWTPSPGKGTGAAGGLGPPPKECDPGRQGCRTPRSGDEPPSDGQGGDQASCPARSSVKPLNRARLGFAAWSLSSVVTPPLELALLLTLPWARWCRGRIPAF